MTDVHPQLIARRRRRRVITASAVVAIAIVAVGCLGILQRIDQRSLERDEYRTDPNRLFVGQCLKELPTENPVIEVNATSCDQPHVAEVVGEFNLRQASLPADDELAAIAEEECAGALRSWSLRSIDDETIVVGFIVPTAEAWNAGMRGGACVATFTTGTRVGPLPR